jgi:hypothetical protein
MLNFKFLNDNNQEPLEYILHEDYDGASWLFGTPENLYGHQYEVHFDNHYGIHSFLNNFPPGFIVTVLSIIGPNGRIHNYSTQYDDGWGFDITSDLITVEWVRFTN